VAGALLATGAVAVGLEASTFEVVFLSDPIGPKALPYLTALILGSAGLGLLVRPDVEVTWPEPSVFARLAGATAVFVAYPALLPVLGFFTSTTAVVTALSVLYGGPPVRATAAAAALAGALWLLFSVVLGLPLPVGDLWTL
jgi:putative tricarboxylic transport membrane protein